MLLILPYLLLQIAAGIEGDTTISDKMQNCTEEADSITPEQLHGITVFYRDCLQISEIRSARKIPKSWTSYSMPSDLLEGNVRTGMAVTQVPDEILFDPRDGEVYAYHKKYWLENPEAKNLSLKDAISEDRAWEQVVPLLKHFGLSTVRGEYHATLNHALSSPQKQDCLEGVTWMFLKRLSYQGTPSRISLILIDVSAQTGRVVSMTYRPVVPPAKSQHLISKTEALKRVKAWITKSSHFKGWRTILDENDENKVEEVVAQPNEWKPPLVPKAISGIRDQSFYCWEVSFRSIPEMGSPGFEQGYSHSYGAWVRVDTGEVIGGWEPY